MLYVKPNTQSKLGTGSRKECLVCVCQWSGGGGFLRLSSDPTPQLKLRSAITNSSVTLTVTGPSLTYAYHFFRRTLFWLPLSVYVYFTNINTRFYFTCANSYISSAVQRVMNKQQVVNKHLHSILLQSF